MWFSFVMLSLTAASVSIAERCDGAHPPKTFKCADVPDIMALQTDKCQPYHMFIGRGTDERAPGRPGNITKLVCDQLGGPEKCGWENIEYPAKNRFISNDTWCKSADIGARNGQAQLKAYAEKCPDSQFILMGYSQGGSIIQDIMGGGGGPIFKCKQSMNAPFDRFKSPGKNIVAAVTAGTVRRVSSESYSVGPGKDFLSEGRRTDEQRLALHPYADVIQDYCNEHDPICANTSHDLNLEFHLTYWELYQKEIVDFIVKKVREKERKSHKLQPLLHQLPTHYWLTGALLFSLALSWLALYCYTSFRRRISGGVLNLPKGMGFAA